MILSLRKHINNEKDSTPSTTVLKRTKFTNFYHLDQLWFELFNKECVEGLADKRNDGADIEKV